MDSSKRRAGAALGDLPLDPLVEILCRVPAKSVCRFKCVSKAWRDLIADPQHRKKLPQAMEGLFCMTDDKSFTACSFSFVDLTARSVPLDIDPSFSFLTELPGIHVLYLLGSCNGLILFEHDQDSNGASVLGYIVCNPTTKEWQAVPPCVPSSPMFTYTYLAFDPAVSSHFNLVQFQVEGDWEFHSVRVYSSETGTWNDNQIDEQGEEGQLEGWHKVRFDRIRSHPRCPFVNGFLHLLVWDEDKNERKIVALDVQGKYRRIITVPEHLVCYFDESQGHLHYMTQQMVGADEDKHDVSIWVLQDYDTKEWVLKGTMNSHDVFEKHGGTRFGFRVIDIHQDRNVVFFVPPLELVAYNMSNKELSVVATFDNQTFLTDTARYVPCFQKSPVKY